MQSCILLPGFDFRKFFAVFMFFLLLVAVVGLFVQRFFSYRGFEHFYNRRPTFFGIVKN